MPNFNKGRAKFYRKGRYRKKFNRYYNHRRGFTPEFKSIDHAWSSEAVDSDGSVLLLNGVHRGTELEARIGNKFTQHSVRVSFHWQNGASPVAVNCQNRFMVVYDNAPQGVLPLLTDIIDSVSLVAHRNLSNRGRFKIIRDEVISVLDNMPSELRVNGYRDWFIRLKGRQMKVQHGGADTGTIADIMHGALYFIALSNIAQGSTTTVVFIRSRTRFTDE